MSAVRYMAIRAAFEALWLSQLPVLIRGLSRAKGVIFTLHRVVPERPADFAPNAILQITPDFLDSAIMRVRELGLETVSMDEAINRIRQPRRTRPFAVFSFDDAYRDNLQYALPILRRRNCPFVLYVPTGLVDGTGEVWWQALEDIVAAQDALSISEDGTMHYLDTKTIAQKQKTFATLYRRMRTLPEPERIDFIQDLAQHYGLDLKAHCRNLIMDWKELKTFAAEPLCTIGNHTVRHCELSKLDPDQVRSEMAEAGAILKVQLGETPKHFSYPIGSMLAAGPREYGIAKDLGFASAVTTRPGGVYHAHEKALIALPRISLNGLFQSRRFLDVFATGAIFSTLAGGAKRQIAASKLT